MNEKDIRCGFCGRRKSQHLLDKVVFISGGEDNKAVICSVCVKEEIRKAGYKEEFGR